MIEFLLTMVLVLFFLVVAGNIADRALPRFIREGHHMPRPRYPVHKM